MAKLTTTKKELLDIFPKQFKFENLDVILHQNNVRNVVFAYIQKNIPDEYSDGEILKVWIPILKKFYASNYINKLSIPSTPKTIDKIYKHCINLIANKEITENDTPLLLVNIEDITIYEQNVAKLDFIIRNQNNPKTKHIGHEFYTNLKPFLEKKGYDYITLTSHSTKFEYWKKQGLKLVIENDINFQTIENYFSHYQRL